MPWFDNTTSPDGHPVRLATAHPINRGSGFGSTWGGDQNRATGIFASVYEADGITPAANQHIAQPGQVAKFSFTLSVPNTMSAGTYPEFFQPISEGLTSMNDPWTFINIIVP